eukprot:g7136.t1
MNDSAISLSNVNIQCAVDCAEDSDTIILSTEYTIQPESTITINKSITISGFHDQEVDTFNDTYPMAQNKAVITCPDNPTQGIFNVTSGGVTIANLEIRDCLNPENASPVVIGKCKDSDEDGIRIHHVDFVNNSGSSYPVAINTLPESSSCGVLEMTDILFQGNKASNEVVFVKLQITTVLRDIRIKNNQPGTDTGQESNFILFSTTRNDTDSLRIDNLVANGNSIPLLNAMLGNVSITNSVFTKNEVKAVNEGNNQDSSMTRFSSVSKVVIKNCSFTNNVGGARGVVVSDRVSSIEIHKSKFRQNSEFGSAIFSSDSILNISASTFVLNNGTISGGVLHLENSPVTIKKSTFRNNTSSESGGAIYAFKSSNIRVRGSKFVKNSAREGGCFHIEESDATITKSIFRKNDAEVDGGAIRLERGGLRCRKSTFEYNTALDDGGAFNIESATYVNWTDVHFSNNRATFGSSARIVKCKNDVLWKNVNFQNSTVGLTGAAAYIDDSKVIIDGATFQNLTAPYGGALYAQSFDITIKNALFKNNHAHVMGGAMSGEIGNITFKNTTFIENNSMLGGALHFFNSTFNASEIRFLNNTGSEGAALLFKDSNVSIGPWPDVKGKIPSSEESSFSFGIFAFNNTGIDNGGAIAAKESNMNISYGAFVDNSAPEGGAIQVTSTEDNSFSITDSLFEGNVADIRGGGIAARTSNGNLSAILFSVQFKKCIADEGGAIFFTSVNAVIENCTFDSNAADDGGAAFIQKSRTVLSDEETFNNRSVTQTISVAVKNCHFTSNKANTRGGALMLRGELVADRQFITSTNGTKGLRYAEDGFNVEIEYVNFTNNRAYTEGGALHCRAVNLTMHNAMVKANNATEGGGAYLIQSVFNISDSKIIGNQAENGGGGIKATQESNGTISFTMIINNKVTKQGEGGGLRISGCTVKGQGLYVDSNNATFGGGVSLALITERDSIVELQDADSRFLCLDCTFINNNASMSGGGVNIQHQNSNITVVAQLENCTFEDNRADVFGGGIHFGRPVSHLDNINEAPCGYLIILNSSFTRNTAGRSGGSFISYDQYKVLVQCSPQTTNTQLFNFLNTTEVQHLQRNNSGYCPQWKGVDAKNVLTVSSYVNRCQATIESKDNWSRINNNSIEISGTVPGERLPDIMVKCYDQFNNIARSDGKGFTATLKSRNEGYLEGIFITDLENGNGNFTGVRNPSNGDTFRKNYTYELNISFSLDFVPPILIQMKVRECRINEEKETEGVLCKPCDATQYNFNPMIETCKPCDNALNCSGTFVRPSENHWHASPCHAHAQKCLTTNACEGAVDVEKKMITSDYKSISSALDEYSCNISNDARKEYQKLLCKEGYEGVLCGSCNKTYGRSLSFAWSLCVWLAIIAGITIRGSMTIEERLSVIKKKLIDLAARKRRTIIESLPEENAENDKAKMIRDNIEKKIRNKSAKEFLSSRKRHKRLISGLSRSTNASYWVGCNLSTNSIGITKETPEEINDRRIAQLAKWKLCEVFKVTINFLQAIAVAAVINVEWTQYMLTLFDMSAFAGGASTALVTRAIHCFPWWNGTRYATYIGLLSGLLIPVFVVLCIVATFAFITYKSSKGMYYFIKRSVLATLAISYFSYLSITRVAIMFFYCVGVRTNENHFSTEEIYYWALDTSIQCSASAHKRLMVFGGILFGLFSVGSPLISAAILVLFRKPFGHKDPQWMSDILGFLYRGYKRKFVYWESTVMLRKALLSVIAVFSYHLGGHTQGLLASSILSVCLFFQAICKPYRYEFETVNKHESLSLLVSGITFTLAQFFMKDRTNDTVKISLSVLLMIAIVGFLLYMIVSMLICLLDVIRTDLIVKGALVDDDDYEDKNSWSFFGTWVASRLGFSRRPSSDNDLELGSIISKTVVTDDDDDEDVAGCSSHVSGHSFSLHHDNTF